MFGRLTRQVCTPGNYNMIVQKQLIRPTLLPQMINNSFMSMQYSPVMMNIRSQTNLFNQCHMRYFSTAEPFQVKINRNPIQTDLQAVQHVGTCEIPKVFYPYLNPKPEGKTCKANRFGIRHSVWKLSIVGRLISGKHIYTAQNTINNIDSKAGEIFRKLLNNGRLNGAQLGLEESRMFVKTVICGKGYMGKQLDIKGRGRMGIIKIPKCSIKIVIEEKPIEEWYKMMIKGECPDGTAQLLKEIAVQSEADFDKVKSLSHMTTSRGRYYRKTQFKRLVQFTRKQYKQKGHNMTYKKIERNLLQKTAQEFAQNEQMLKDRLVFTNRSARQELFDKNYSKK